MVFLSDGQEASNSGIISKSFNCDELFHVLVQFPKELEDVTEATSMVRKPITCFVSNKEQSSFNGNNASTMNEANEQIEYVYFTTPNPKKIGEEDHFQTTLVETREDQIMRSLGLKLSMLIFRQVGLSKTPVYLYLTSDLRENVQWEGDVISLLTACKKTVRL